MARLVALLFLAAVVVVGDAFESAPTVTTSAGTAYGTQLPASAGGVKVNQFLGLPFAAAQRWQPPVDFTGKYPAQPRNSTMWGSACLQVLSANASYGSEDCLKANVWQPSGVCKPGVALPVLVFIYGGSNEFGEAEPYNMSGIAAFQDTVAVNFNYRTGPIGWLAFEEDKAAGRSTGNWGLMDIQSALRWVQREVGAFCGDPRRVAIHGQSSGGGLVELQYVSPTARGLFAGAISESGGLGATSWEDSVANTARVARNVGCYSAKAVPPVSKACMTNLTALQITSLTDVGDWGPIVDGVVVPGDPMQMLLAGKVNPVSAMFGAQTNDSQLFLFQDNTKGGNSQPNDHPDGDLKKLHPNKLLEDLKNMVGYTLLPNALELYPIDEEPTVHNLHTYGRAEADSMLCGARRRSRAFAKARGNGTSFMYRFNYWYQSNKACTAVPNYHGGYMGAVHQDEVTFVMGQPNFMEQGSCCGRWGLSEGAEGCPKTASCTACYDTALGEGYAAYFNANELAFAKQVGSFWSNFSSGNPNSASGHGPGAWPPAVDGVLVLDANLPGHAKVEAEVNGEPSICRLWDAANARGYSLAHPT